jgi:hypothetical protein
MNEESNEDISEQKVPEYKPEDITQFSKPSKGCRHCYGRGYEGWDSATRLPVPCRCMYRKSDNKLTFGMVEQILRKKEYHE